MHARDCWRTDSYLMQFDTVMMVNTDEKWLDRLPQFARAWYDRHVVDAIRAVVGPRVFLGFKTSDFNGFEIQQGPSLPQATDDAAWEAVKKCMRDAADYARDYEQQPNGYLDRIGW